MNRIIRIAGAVFLLQIILIGVSFWFFTGAAKSVPNTPFLSFSPDTVDTIELAEQKGGRIVLKKTSAGWIIDDERALAADAQQINSLLKKLATQKQGFAVATTAGANQRFLTGDENYQHHLLCKEGEKSVVDLYIGSAAGFKKSHVRKNGSTEIFSLEVSSFELAATTDKWLDKHILKIAETNIQSLKFPGFTLERNNDSWQIADSSPQARYNGEEIKNLLTKICDLTVDGVADVQTGKKLFSQPPQFSFAITLTDGNTIEYSFIREGEKSFISKVSNRDQYFRFFPQLIEDLKQYSKDKLLGLEQGEKKKEEKKAAKSK